MDINFVGKYIWSVIKDICINFDGFVGLVKRVVVELVGMFI